MMMEGQGLYFHPVDQSESTQHQVVTATGESALLYGKECEPSIGEVDDIHFSEDDSFPAKKVCIQQSGIGKDIIKPAKFKLPEFIQTEFKPVETDEIKASEYKLAKIKQAEFKQAEIDVTSGNRNESPEHDLVSLKKSKKQKAEEVEVIDLISDNTFDNLNINIRQDAWEHSIVQNGKHTRGVRADNVPDCFGQLGLLEDNFDDFSHLNSRVYDEFLKGFVILGTKNAVSTLLSATSSLKMGVHGVIVDNSLPPSFEGLFEEGVCRQYTIAKQLGKGSFGTVSYCRHADGQHYVKKVINEKFNRKEVEVLMQLSHPNITAFRGYIFRDGSHEIMMEYGGDSLKTLMEKNKTNYREILMYDVVVNMALQGFSALEYMYERFGILHLDIKPENICIQLDPAVLKFTDFGTSKTPQQAVTFDGWTPEYMSPEACRLLLAPKFASLPEFFAEDLTGKADVFAFGLVVCFMLTGNHTVCKLWPKTFTEECPFAKWLPQWRSQYIVHLALNPTFIQNLAIQDDWPREMRDLLTSSLEGSTSQRVTASEACNFIKQQMLSHQVNIPAVVSPGSPSGPSTSNIPTVESIYNDPPASPMDVSLNNAAPRGGGKDIRNQLRRKLRRKSAAPYQRQQSVAPPVKPDNTVSALPIFSALGMDD